MALIDSSDVELRIAASTSGQQQVATLAAELDELANKGGEAAPQFAALAAELRKLDNQQSLIQQFTQLKKETVEAGSALAQAQERAQRLGREFAATENPSRKLTNEFNRSRKEVKEAATALQQKQLALQNVRGAMNTAGVGTTDLAQKQAGLRTALNAVTAEASAMTAKFSAAGAGAGSSAAQIQKAGAASTAAARNLDKLNDEAERAGGVFIQLGTNLTGVAAAVGAAFGATQLVGFAKSLGPIADASAELEARLRLAVGASGDLDAALQAVQLSANQAGANINSIGELYGRIAQSTEELGFSQQRVADLTDTINKSFSVSGTSAAAASGAITQLAQAFAAGALRGDEFNSVNEAAPRLMAALAAGLGVTRGELRGLAEDGKLTTEVVLEALESQREAIERDFGQLPDTIGRATQRLANNWQVFIGQLDESTGASETVANGLNMVAENLDDIAAAATTAGEVVAAALAIKAAAALRQYVVLTTGATAATAAKTVALNAMAAAGTRATGALLALGRAMPVLAVGGLIAALGSLVFEFFRAKAAAEEGEEAFRRMMEEPAPNRLAQEVRLLATEAEAARFKLSEMQLEFAKLRRDGKGVAEALRSVASEAEIANTDGIVQLITGLDELRKGADATGQQIQTALTDRLKRLSSSELSDFGLQAQYAFQQGQISAEQLAFALDSRTRVALAALKIDADVALTGVSAKFTEATGSVRVLVQDLDRLKASGVETATVLDQALDAALKSASTPEEFEQLVELIKKLGAEGYLAGQKVDEFLGKIAEKVADITPEVDSLAEALKTLGVRSDADLKKTATRAFEAYQAVLKLGGSAREAAEAFRRWAEADVAANNGVVSATVQAEAAKRGLIVAADEAGRVTVTAMNAAANATAALRGAAEEAASAVAMIGGAADEAAAAVDNASNSIQGFRSGSSGNGGRNSFAGMDFTDLVSEAGRVGGDALRDEALALINAAIARNNRAAARGVGGYRESEASIRAGLESLIGSGGSGSSAAAVSRTETRRYAVQVGMPGGRQEVIQTASDDDAQRLSSLLSQLQVAQRTAA